MKRFILFVMIAVMFYGFSYTQTIRVIKPVANTYYQTDTIKIEWNVNNITGDIKIILRKADGSGGIKIYDNYPASALTCNYKLESISPGKYFIKIKQGTVFGKSPVFTVLKRFVFAPIIKKPIAIKFPDLIVCISNGKRPPVFRKRAITAVVKNIGESMSKACKLRIYVKQKGVTFHNIPQLRPGQSFSVTRKHKWSTAGTKKIKANIDYYNTVNESKENNNIVEGAYFVRLPHHNTYSAGYKKVCSDGTKSYK